MRQVKLTQEWTKIFSEQEKISFQNSGSNVIVIKSTSKDKAPEEPIGFLYYPGDKIFNSPVTDICPLGGPYVWGRVLSGTSTIIVH